MRYEWAGVPVWSSPKPPPGAAKPPPCPGCGSPRAFELQLMPALLFGLKVESFAEASPKAAGAAAAGAAAVDAGGPTEAGADPPAPGGPTGGRAPLPPELRGMDWGTVAVYACSKSCSTSEEEFVVVQPPID